MKKFLLILLLIFFFLVSADSLRAQCSICTKTASQLGETSAKGLNGGILYLMLTPFTVAIFLGVRWWKREKEIMKDEADN
ncbi:MAG: hypothetical protein ABJA79_05635 [Parafilimonas sp.]